MVIVQKCVFSGSEMISDAFDTTEEYDGFVLKCKSHTVTKGGVRVDIGDNYQDPDAAKEDDDEDSERVNDVVDGFCMVGMALSKKEFQTYIKSFMMKVKGHLEEKDAERTAGFMKSASACVKYLLGKFDDLEL